MAGMREIALY